jgi:hypothetical protein
MTEGQKGQAGVGGQATGSWFMPEQPPDDEDEKDDAGSTQAGG